MPLRVIAIALLLWGILAPCAQAAPSRLSVAVGSDSVPLYSLQPVTNYFIR